MRGDVFELRDPANVVDLIRVIAVYECRLWVKVYGPKGHQVWTLSYFRQAIAEAVEAKIVTGADDFVSQD